MAEHVKTQLRKAVEQRLRDAVPTLSTVVSSARLTREFQSDEYPVATVEVTESVETVGAQRMESRPIKRDFSVSIILVLRANIDELEDKLSALHVDVEKALITGSNINVNGLQDWVYEGSSQISISDEAGIGVLPLRYSGFITTRAGNPSAAL